MKRLIAFIIFDILVLLCAAAIKPQEPPKIDYGPQITMVVIGMKNGQKYVVPTATVILKLTPSSGPTVNAPLTSKDYLICRAFTVHEERPAIAFRCGTDVYVLQSVEFIPPK
jgi:hypothetical protein